MVRCVCACDKPAERMTLGVLVNKPRCQGRVHKGCRANWSGDILVSTDNPLMPSDRFLCCFNSRRTNGACACLLEYTAAASRLPTWL